MFSIRFVCLALAAACLLGMGIPTLAAEVDSDAAYCFTAQDFSQSEDPLAGICITALPTASGTVFLGNRVVQPGDILTAGQLEEMTFQPLSTQADSQATVSYLPIYENRVEPQTQMTLSIRGKEDLAPVAQDSTLETYKNLPNDDSLRASDPEGKELTYSLVRSPRRGDVELRPDGSFTYTPKKNKVGVDSFTFTAADPAGNVSREATVTIQILKPSDARQYADTAGLNCRFEAEWLRNTGLFTGESVDHQQSFHPEKAVSRGDFMAMLVRTLQIPTENTPAAGMAANAPQWLQPYLTAALRAGLLNHLPAEESSSYDWDQPMDRLEAAVMVQNALDLTVDSQMLETAAETWAAEEEEIPAWAKSSLAILAEHGVCLPASGELTRGDAANLLYQANRLSANAPGMSVIRMHQ
jgi:hypothetical protein